MTQPAGRGYWVLTTLLVGSGLIAIASVGMPLLVAGVTLAALSPYRSRPRIFWTVMSVVLGLVAGYALFAPFDCIASSTAQLTTEAVSRESCRSLIGIGYAGSALAPGLIGGGVVALLGGMLGWWLTRPYSRRSGDDLSDTGRAGGE